MVVYKARLDARFGAQTIFMEKHSQILRVEMQNDDLMVWYLCNPKNEEYAKTFMIVPTGLEFNKEGAENWVYINTVFYNGIVLHAFYK